MPIIIGVVLLALGISLAVAWWPQLIVALQGGLVLTLLFCGAVLLLVGYSEMKARREYASAINDDTEAEPT